MEINIPHPARADESQAQPTPTIMDQCGSINHPMPRTGKVEQPAIKRMGLLPGQIHQHRIRKSSSIKDHSRGSSQIGPMGSVTKDHHPLQPKEMLEQQQQTN
ncbi:hypothetical protein Nepgr_010455 [Nepenthes gracilis]|uniref:Uncharacterized protein n=1 Tax=Nepenthes gracilis TaxID=150966 RepID=A0AAD3SCH7_NEPGR|nr:hypothetical protein Nepgr_010455 [Nepenthes gracilis]